MDNTNYWPYTNIHELNLDWIISKVKELDTRFTDDIETFVREYIDEHFAEWTVNANYDPDDETIIYTNGTGATLTAGDVIRFAIDNVYVNVKDPTARTAAGNAATAAAAAQRTADNIIDGITAIPYVSTDGGTINGNLVVNGSLSANNIDAMFTYSGAITGETVTCAAGGTAAMSVTVTPPQGYKLHTVDAIFNTSWECPITQGSMNRTTNTINCRCYNPTSSVKDVSIQAYVTYIKSI